MHHPPPASPLKEGFQMHPIHRPSAWHPSSLATLLACALLCTLPTAAQDDFSRPSRNTPERLEWFRDQGFGLFIHWSVDSQLGVVISHSLVGASPEYTTHFFNDLPKTFDPTRFDPDEWARLAKVAGVRYVMFTTKHHNGFTMFPSATTPFGIAATPFKRDPTKEIFNAFRAQGIAAGVYFSPDDFYWLHQHGKTIQRLVPDVQPSNNPGLLAYDKAQLTELFTHYGKIDLAYFDGEAKDLRELAWNLQPNVVVTRGAIVTPELSVPGAGLPGAWEASIPMGTAWEYQPDNEVYQSGHDLIRLIFQTRAKGGNILLNVGPKPNGELAIEQENRLREIGLWMFVNGEAIYSVRPWVLTNERLPDTPAKPGAKSQEDRVWFTQKKDHGPLYAILDSPTVWERGTWKDITLHSVRATPKTTISILGQDDKTVEYKPNVIPKSTFTQQPDGLHIHVMRAQRLQDNSHWPNATVVKLTDVEPALEPPHVATSPAAFNAEHTTLTLTGDLLDLGDSKTLNVGFEYRLLSGEDVNARSTAWIPTETRPVTAKGPYTLTVPNLTPGTYEYHAVVRHPLLTLYGTDRIIR
jgi:alpha-L-fucosidase